MKYRTRFLAFLMATLLMSSMTPAALAATATGAPHVFLADDKQVNAENPDQILVWLDAARYEAFAETAGTLDILEKIAVDEGIELVFVNKTEDERAFLDAKLAAGEVPDVIETNLRFADYDKLVADGTLAEIPMDVIKNNMPNFAAWAEKWGGPNIWKRYERNGKNYALPNILTPGSNSMGLGIREDIFAAAGAAVPTTIDEWTDAMSKIKAAFDTATIGGQRDLIEETLGFVYGAYGAYPGIFYEQDGKIVYGSIQPEVKEGLKVLADWYANGYIDPDFNTLDNAGLIAKWEEGKVAATVFYWWTFCPRGTLYGTDYYNVTDNNPQAKVANIEFPKGPNDLAGTVQGNADKVGPVFGKHMTQEQIIKYLKIYDKYAMTKEGVNLLMDGIHGTHYNYDAATGVQYVSPFDTEEGRLSAGIRVVDAIPAGLVNEELQAYTNFSPELQSIRDAGSEKCIGARDEMANFSRPVYAEKKTALDKLANDFFYDVITGVKTVDEFDAFVADWLAAGGQEVLDEANAIWGAAE